MIQQLLNKGLPTNRLNTAISQVNNWREYLEKRPVEFQSDLSAWCKDRDILKWHDVGEEPCNYTGDYLHDPATVFFTYYHIVIGRRSNISKEKRRKMNQLRMAGNVQINTYDQYIDIAANYDRHKLNPEVSVRLTRTNEEL